MISISSLLRKMIAAVMAMSLAMPSGVFAATLMPADIAPDDVTSFTQLNFGKLPANDLLAQFKNLLVDTFGTSSKSSDLLKTLLDHGEVIDASKNGLDTSEYVMYIVTDTELQNYLSTSAAETKGYHGHVYYLEKEDANDTIWDQVIITPTSFEGPTASAKIGNYLVLTDEDHIKTLFDKMDKGEVLSKNPKFQATLGALGTNNFVGYFSDLEASLKNMMGLASSLKQMGYTVSAFDGGMSFDGITVYPSKNDSNIYTPSTFKPMLYAYAPAQKPLFYYEGTDLAKLAKSQQDLMSSELSLDKTSSGYFDSQKDFADLITKQYSVTVEKGQGTMVPMVTLMANVQSEEAAARSSVEKFYTMMDHRFKAGEIFQQNANGDYSHYTLTIHPTADQIENSGGLFPKEYVFHLDINLHDDGVLVISTNPNISQQYKTGMDASAFGDKIQRTDMTGLYSLSFTDIKDILKEAMQQYYMSLDSDMRAFFDIGSATSALEQMLSPWQRVSGYATLADTHEDYAMKLYFDSKIYKSAYWDDVKKSGEVLMEAFDAGKKVSAKFKDVPKDQWYYADVRMMRARGIVKGYDDGSFKPGRNVTRAEFLTMLYRGVYGQPPIAQTMTDTRIGSVIPVYSDLDQDSWYYDVISDASAKKLVSGYSDGTFHPNALITRSEAVAMIHRFYQYNNDFEAFVNLKSRDDHSFSDVPESAWYSASVHEAYRLGVVDGNPSGAFEPGRNLNRAEAAKLIHQLLRAEDGVKQ